MSENNLMLAHVYDGKIDINGWYASEKLDGIRAYWNGHELYSKQGKKITFPTHLIQKLPKDLHLDGELYVGRKKFDVITSIVRKKNPIKDEWDNVKYMIFDIPNLKKTFKEKKEEFDKIKNDFVFPMEFWIVENKNILFKKLEILNKENAEGIMLRNPNSFYEHKRTKSLLKLKSFYDSEAIIIGHNIGNGKYKGILGALVVKTLKNDTLDIKENIQFKIGSGFRDEERNRYKELFPVGSKVTYKFTETSKTGVPRFPTYHRTTFEL